MPDPTIILDIEPDWSTDPAVTYAFQSALQETPYFVQQRRPILLSPIRTVGCKFTESDEVFQRLRNTLLAAKGERICVPIFCEPIFSSSIVTGGSSITATTDLSTLWNINNCDYVVLIDTVTGQSEMLGVVNVTGQLIAFVTNIVGSWVAAQTVIYPAIAAALSSVKESNTTDGVGSIEAEFEESVLWEEATEEWVGFEAKYCLCGYTISSVGDFIDVSNGPYSTASYYDYVWDASLPVAGALRLSNYYASGICYSYAANALLNATFSRTGTFGIEFDFYHGDDEYNYSDDLWSTSFDCVLLGAPAAAKIPPDDGAWGDTKGNPWQNFPPGYKADGLWMPIRKLTTAKNTVYQMASGASTTLYDGSLSGLDTTLYYGHNKFKWVVEWSKHTFSTWVNGVAKAVNVSFSSYMDSLIGDNFQFLFHWHRHQGGQRLRWVGGIKIYR